MHNTNAASADEAILREVANRSIGTKKPKGAQTIASVHEFLKEGKTGYINDGDPTHYLHRDGYKFGAPEPSFANPLEGGPGQKLLEDMPADEQRNYNQHMNDLIERQYHTGRMA